jgi:flagellin-like hook-associated protein FlgL
LATELKGARDFLVGLANTTDGNGQYLFSGYQGGKMPYQLDPSTGKVTYKGDTGQRNMQVEQARQLASGDIGSDIFGRPAAGALAYITSVIGNLSSTNGKNLGNATFSAATFDAASATNYVGNDFDITFLDSSVTQGAGNTGDVSFDFVDTSPPSEHRDSTYTVTYQTGVTIKDVNKIVYNTVTDPVTGETTQVPDHPVIATGADAYVVTDAVAGSPFYAGGGTLQPPYDDPATYTPPSYPMTLDIDGASFTVDGTAAAAGDTWTLEPGKLTYGSLSTDKDNTGKADIKMTGAVGAASGDHYDITFDGTNYIVDDGVNPPTTFAPAASITFNGITLDLSNPATAKAGDTWHLDFGDYTDGGVIDMNGVQTTISGTPVEGDTFSLQTPDEDNMDMFANLNSLIDALDQSTSGNPTALSDIVNRLATVNKQLNLGLDNILTVNASVGSRLNELDALGDTGTQKGLSYKKQSSDLEDVDVFQVTSDLMLRKVALDAASQAFINVMGTSLFSRAAG